MQNISSSFNHKQNTITYRNALYQGEIDFDSQCRTKFGIVYQAKTHQFTCCKNWQYDRLSGQSLFFNSDKRYSYGYWLNNKPHGFNVFRIQDKIIFLVFKHGKIEKNSKLIVYYEKYNLGFILIIKNQTNNLQDIQFEILQKRQIFSSQGLYQFFKLCQWPQNYFIDGQTIIRFISNRIILPLSQDLTSKTKHNHDKIKNVKLRLLSNKYYRFGFDEGLALIFDQDYKRISVGIHSKAKLKSYGISYNHYDSRTYVEQGLFDKDKLFKFDIKGITTADYRQINKVYQNNLLSSVNFSNSFYRNISKIYEQILQCLLLNSLLLKEQIQEHLIIQKQINDQTLKFSNIQTKIDQSQTKYNIFVQTKQDKNRNVLSGSIYKNQILNDRLRLQNIKKQIYQSIERRKITNNNQNQDKDKDKDKGFQNTKNLINRTFNPNKNDFTLFEPDRQNPKLLQTPQRNINKSKSRKKIFQQQSKYIKQIHDYTPSRSQKNLTPFKAKMKNRIFDSDHIKTQNQRQIINQSRLNEKDMNITNKNKNIQEIKKKDEDSRLKLKIQEINPNSFQYEDRYKYDQKKDQYRQIKNSKNHQYIPINTTQQKMKKRSHNSTLNQKNTNSFQQEQLDQCQKKKPLIINQQEKKKLLILNQQQNLTNNNNNDFHENINSYKLMYSQSKKGLISNKNQTIDKYDKSRRNSPQITNKNFNLTDNDKRRSFHKNSNQIYLQGQQKNSISYQQRRVNQKNYDNKYQVNSPIKYQSKSNTKKSSYMKKYQNKKLNDKQIQISPDRFRCYGKSSQHPYLDTTYQNNRIFSDENSNKKGIDLKVNPAKSYYNQTLSFARQKKQKFF